MKCCSGWLCLHPGLRLASDVQADTMAEMGRRPNESVTQQFTMRSRAEVARFFGGCRRARLTHSYAVGPLTASSSRASRSRSPPRLPRAPHDRCSAIFIYGC